MPAKRKAAGLMPEKYLAAGELAQLRAYVRRRAHKRKSRAAHTDFLAVEILACSGLRAGELVATREHPGRYLRIRDLPCHHGKNVICIVEAKHGSARSVIIPESLVAHIAKYVQDHRQGAESADPLFQARTGKPMCYGTLRRKLRLIGEEMGLTQRLKPHMLRHSYAMSLYGVEHDLRLVQQQLGHADPQTTTIYANTTAESARRQVEAL